MSTSRHAALSQSIVDYLDDTWVNKPANAEIVRAYDYEHLVDSLRENDKSVVAVITPRSPSERAMRTADHDRWPVFVCIMAALDGISTADVDPWDVITESCRDALRSDSLKSIDIGSGQVFRQLSRPDLVTPYDADALNTQSVFLSVIELEYQILVEAE